MNTSLAAVSLAVVLSLLAGCGGMATRRSADTSPDTAGRVDRSPVELQASVAEATEAVRWVFEEAGLDDVAADMTAMDGYVRGKLSSRHEIRVTIRYVTDQAIHLLFDEDEPLFTHYVIPRVMQRLESIHATPE